MFTKHANDRMKQRGFNKEHIHFILKFGIKKRVGSAVRYQLTRRVAKNLRYKGFPIVLIDKCKSAYVVSEGEIIITVAHMH